MGVDERMVLEYNVPAAHEILPAISIGILMAASGESLIIILSPPEKRRITPTNPINNPIMGVNLEKVNLQFGLSKTVS